MTSKGDLYRRKQSIIDTAKQNDLVASLFQQHYKEIQHLQDHTEIFTDTYLILTRTYKPDQDFVSEFKRQFRNFRLEYYEKSRQLNYQLTSYDNADNSKNKGIAEKESF